MQCDPLSHSTLQNRPQINKMEEKAGRRLYPSVETVEKPGDKKGLEKRCYSIFACRALRQDGEIRLTPPIPLIARQVQTRAGGRRCCGTLFWFLSALVSTHCWVRTRIFPCCERRLQVNPTQAKGGCDFSLMTKMAVFVAAIRIPSCILIVPEGIRPGLFGREITAERHT